MCWPLSRGDPLYWHHDIFSEPQFWKNFVVTGVSVSRPLQLQRIFQLGFSAVFKRCALKQNLHVPGLMPVSRAVEKLRWWEEIQQTYLWCPGQARLGRSRWPGPDQGLMMGVATSKILHSIHQCPPADGDVGIRSNKYHLLNLFYSCPTSASFQFQ